MVKPVKIEMDTSVTPELRLRQRWRTVGSMPAPLLDAKTREVIPCRPVDMSAEGLGIFTTNELRPDMQFIMPVKEREIRLKLIWSSENAGERPGYRHGIQAIDKDINLEQIFIECGCFKPE